MIVSRCCKASVVRTETAEGDYWSCVECHRACETFCVLVLSDGVKEIKDKQQGDEHG